MKLAEARTFATGKKTLGLTLLELMVAVAVGSIALSTVGTLWVFALRSFASMSNYVDLDAKSRLALDLMTLEMRQATAVIDFQKTGTRRWITLTNADDGVTIKYTWDQTDRSLVFDKTGQPTQTFLTECDAWNFEVYQRTPQPNATNLFFPATNSLGVYDTTICKLVDMSWACSRTIIGSKINTESVQTAQVVLRNKQ